MIKLDGSQIIEGLMVYRDNDNADRFYIIPDQPRFRVDEVTKKPVFQFIKYKNPIDNKDGSKGGGFLVFDFMLTVPDDKMKKIEDKLNAQLQSEGWKGSDGQPLKATFARPNYTAGTANLVLLDSGGSLVTKIESVGKPSLFGSMICSFTAELSPEGATVIEAVMKKSGGVAQISYDLHSAAALPPITAHVWFYASKAYSFVQTVDKSGGSWDSSNDREVDTLREKFMASQAGGVDFHLLNVDQSDPVAAAKTADAIKNWAWAQLDTAVKTAVLPDIKAAEDRGDHGMDHITKTQSMTETSDFNRWFKEQDAVDFHIIPQGTLPNIVDMGFKWEDYAIAIDANDPFFAQIHASVAVNADFQKFQINSVDVHCEYTKTNPATIKDFHFTKPDDVGKFDSDTANGDMEYAYSYTVNYIDQSLPYQSPLIKTNKAQITINANALGILYVSVAIGSVDFAKTPQVQVALRYPDNDANGHPISTQINFDSSKKSDDFVAVLLKPVDKSYEYQVTYIMADGSQMVSDWKKGESSEVFVNSPFILHTYSFLAEGDFTTSIDNIFLKMQYSDPDNHIEQETDFLFSGTAQSKDWTIPVVANAKGQITYSGVISYKDHTKESLPPTTTDRDLIEFGPPNQAIISVTPDATLIDFSQVKLVKVDLEYKDPANNIDVKHEYLLKPNMNSVPAWTFYARDKNLTTYTYTSTFYMATTPPSVVQVPAATSSDSDLVLMMPS